MIPTLNPFRWRQKNRLSPKKNDTALPKETVGEACSRDGKNSKSNGSLKNHEILKNNVGSHDTLSSPSPRHQVTAKLKLDGPSAEDAQTQLAPKRQFWRKVLWISPLSNLLGGSLLITGACLPREAPQKAEIQLTQEQTQWNQNLADIKKTLTQLGWTFTATGSLMGCINGISLGYRYQQPSMVLAALSNMIASPILMIQPSVSLRAAMLLMGGPWMLGFANHVRNTLAQKEEGPGGGVRNTTIRQYDMAPLISRHALQKSLLETLPQGTSLSVRQEILGWLTQAAGMVKFSVVDHGQMVNDLGQGLKKRLWGTPEPPQNPQSPPQTIPNTPEAIPVDGKIVPSPMQNQLGAFLMYAGSIPMLVLSGESVWVNEICTKLIAAGSLASDSSLFFSAVHEKNKALMVGIPLRNLGGAFMHTDIGMGVNLLGRSVVQDHFRKEIIRPKEESELSQGPETPAREKSSKIDFV
ncbi:MAG: hypothetical protein K2X66_18695 [Cyanobacteria bacterium]|nr:hypothetical protein [Cyanobacteriota bacterium]